MISAASSCLVLKILSSTGIPASLHRSLSPVHDVGRYKRQSTSEACLPLHRQPKTATWELCRFARIATVLMANSYALIAFFHPTAFIDQQARERLSGQRLGNIFCHLVYHSTGIPVGIADKMVHGMITRIKGLAYPFYIV